MSKSFFNNSESLEDLKRLVPSPWEVHETDIEGRSDKEVKIEFPISTELITFPEFNKISARLTRVVGLRLCLNEVNSSSDVGQYVRRTEEESPDQETEAHLDHMIFVRMRWPLPNDIVQRLSDTGDKIIDICLEAVPDQVPTS